MPVEAIDLHPAAQLFELLVAIAEGLPDALVGVGLEELRQQLDEPERRVVLALVHEGPQPPAALRRGGATAAGADRSADPARPAGSLPPVCRGT